MRIVMFSLKNLKYCCLINSHQNACERTNRPVINIVFLPGADVLVLFA